MFELHLAQVARISLVAFQENATRYIRDLSPFLELLCSH